MSGRLGEALATPIAGYSFVYHLEIGLLFATLAVLGPLVRTRHPEPQHPNKAMPASALPNSPPDHRRTLTW